MTPSIYIAYGSESGNAHSLSYNLKKLLSRFKPRYSELNDVDLTTLSNDDYLIIITSTTGDGEAPDNAKMFYRNLIKNRKNVSCHYAVFGLGSVNYEKFCGFSNIVDAMLKQAGATAITNRVDADYDYDLFYENWSAVLVSFFNNENGAKDTLQKLILQVDPDI